MLLLAAICLLLLAPSGVSAAENTQDALNMASPLKYSARGYFTAAWNKGPGSIPVYVKAHTTTGTYTTLEKGGAMVVDMKAVQYRIRKRKTQKLQWIPVYMNNMSKNGKTVTAYLRARDVSLTNLNPKKLSGNKTVNRALNYGLNYLGTPFLLGAASVTKGIDCANFVSCIYRAAGKSMPSWSHTDTLQGASRQVSRRSLKAGDLVFYLKYDTHGPIDHVGVYLGKGLILNASGHYGQIYPQGGICIKRLSYGAREPVKYTRLNGIK